MSPDPEFPYDFIGKILITPEEIEKRVSFIGNQIHNDYRDSEKLLLLGLLRGSVVFITDLMRKVQIPLTMDFMSCLPIPEPNPADLCASILTTKQTSADGMSF